MFLFEVLSTLFNLLLVSRFSFWPNLHYITAQRKVFIWNSTFSVSCVWKVLSTSKERAEKKISFSVDLISGYYIYVLFLQQGFSQRSLLFFLPTYSFSCSKNLHASFSYDSIYTRMCRYCVRTQGQKFNLGKRLPLAHRHHVCFNFILLQKFCRTCITRT